CRRPRRGPQCPSLLPYPTLFRPFVDGKYRSRRPPPRDDVRVAISTRAVAAAVASGKVRPVVVATAPTATPPPAAATGLTTRELLDRKSTRLNSSHVKISYAVFCL